MKHQEAINKQVGYGEYVYPHLTGYQQRALRSLFMYNNSLLSTHEQ